MPNTMRVPLTRGQVALIDADDYPVVSALSWRASPNPMGGYYATAAAKRADGRTTTLYMHRLITGAPKGKEVDHWNHDTLDNRRENLRVGSHKANMENGKFALTTHCPKGHAYDEANTYVNAKGKRFCRECNRLRVASVYAAETPEQRALRLTKDLSRYHALSDVERDKRNAQARARRAARKVAGKR